MREIVTGGASGIGAAICARLAAERLEIEALDIVSGFDVARPEHWERVGPVDVACLNAGVVTGETDHAWAVQPGREPVDFRFPRVPGPRGPGGESYPPPPSFA